MEPLLTISIPTFHNYQQLRWTLESMLRYTEFPYKVVVVNNGGDDNEIVDKVLSGFPYQQMEVIHPGENLGWMGANNLSLDQCDTPFYCVCNDDVHFIPGQRHFWRALINHFAWDEKTAAVGPSSNFVAGVQNLYKMETDMLMETTLLIGFCCVFRTAMLKEIGGLDASLPGGDDMDWSIRLRKKGYHLIADRSVYLHHIGQQTGKKLFGENWDSMFSQENTNNALIRKHGIMDWHDTFSAWWKPVDMDKPEFTDTEDRWYEEKYENHKDGKGVNLGCNDTVFGKGCVGLDKRRKGEMGAGGTKMNDVDSDTTADVCDLPMQDGSLDYIFAAHILEHISDPIAALQEWQRVLKPGGVLYMTLPNEDAHETMVLDYTHKHAYNPKAVLSLLVATGWETTGCEPAVFGTIRIVATKPTAVDYAEKHL